MIARDSESAIMQYLADQKPASGLFPRDPQARADVTRWQFWDASHFSPQLGTLIFEKIIKPLMNIGEPDPRKIEEAIAGFRRFAAVLDGHLTGKPYIVGRALTIADLTIACSLMYAERTAAPLGEFPVIEAWLARIRDLAAWRATEPQ
jgi:glutathione S-transferase